MDVVYATWHMVVHQCLARLVIINAIIQVHLSMVRHHAAAGHLVQIPSFNAFNVSDLRRINSLLVSVVLVFCHILT